MTSLKDVRLPSETEMRQAVGHRDARYDGTFFFAVITTGVFCVPSCSARPARPENLRFYFTAQNARAAGFRSCKRCQPDNAIPLRTQLIELARHIESHANERLPLAELAQRCSLSPQVLQKRFKALFGVTPRAFQTECKTRRLKQALRETDSVTQAMLDAGYTSSSRLHAAADQQLGMTPSAYQAGGAGEAISYATTDSPLGPLTVAATDRGLCFAQFGASARSLQKQLRTEFPNASLSEVSSTEQPLLGDWLDALTSYLKADGPMPDLPLDVRGTAFQVSVWQFLMSVPSGETVSYAQVAAGVGKPKAVRAAASACGANRIALFIPCHRVLRGSGALGGYRWGTPRKQSLLDLEGCSNRDG